MVTWALPWYTMVKITGTTLYYISTMVFFPYTMVYHGSTMVYYDIPW